MGREAEFPEVWREGVYAAIFQRRDIRAFRTEALPDAVLARVLNAAHHAGSVGFMQPWNFIVLREAGQKRRIWEHVEAERLRAAEAFSGERREKYLSYRLEGIREAPVNVVVTCDPERNGPAVLGRFSIPETDLFSTCCAIQNLWLAARAENVGVGWVSILQPEFLRAELKLPGRVVPVAYLCVGYPVEFPERPMLESTGWLPRAPLCGAVSEGAWGAEPAEGLRAALAEVQRAGGVGQSAG